MPKILFARPLLPDERRKLLRMAEGSDPMLAKRARVILLSADERYRVPEISVMVKLRADKVRKWIRRFNERGIEGLYNRRFKPGPRSKYRGATREKIVEIAQTPPRQLGLLFSQWTLHDLRRYLLERGVVDRISHETLRKILKEENVDWRHNHVTERFGRLRRTVRIHRLEREGDLVPER